jgi:hypothetical protein
MTSPRALDHGPVVFSSFICALGEASARLRTLNELRCGLGGLFGFASRNFGLQQAIFRAAVDLLFAKPVETRGVATCFGHDFLFSNNGNCPGGERYGVKRAL